MQASASPVAAALDVPGDVPEQAHFCFNPMATSFQPMQQLLGFQDEFSQDLHAVWLNNAMAWEDEEASCIAAVWFVDHRWNHPHGTNYRKARLWADFLMWYQVLETSWIDFRDPSATLEFHIVQPSPICDDAEVKIHVILAHSTTTR